MNKDENFILLTWINKHNQKVGKIINITVDSINDYINYAKNKCQIETFSNEREAVLKKLEWENQNDV